MTQDYQNLELARKLMCQKSTSDYSKSHGTGEKLDMQDASGCLVYINSHYHDDNKALMKCAVSSYVCDEQKARLYESVRQLAMQGYQSKSMKAKYADKMAKAVMCDTLQKTLTDRECATILGVSKGGYSRFHAPVFDFVSGEVNGVLSIADDVAGEYWRKTFRS